MKRLAPLFFLILLSTSLDLRAQTATMAPGSDPARNAAYLEIGGSAIALSINYERRFTERWHGRVGLSSVTGETSEDTETTLIIPLTVSSVNRPESNHHLELGGGLTIVTGDRQDLWESVDDDEKASNVVLTGIVGYRYQKPQGGFQFRAALTPIVGNGIAAPWLGVSFGYAW